MTATPEPDADDLDNEVWTDCHFHPKSTTWKPAAGALPDLLATLGITQLGAVTLSGTPDEWDCADEQVPLFEGTDIPASEIPALIAEHAAEHASLLAAVGGTALDGLAASLPSEVGGNWEPMVVSVGWGLTTLPDASFTQTQSRFAWSAALGGPGLPVTPERQVVTLPRLDAVVATRDALTAALGVPLAVSVAYAAMA